MEILPESERHKILVGLVRCPEEFDNADRWPTAIEVEIRNGSSVVLSSTGSNPVHISYFWIHPDGTREEGLRSPISPPLPPAGSTSTFSLALHRPRISGQLTLRVTLVQEHVFWFSEPPVSRFIDVAVTVSTTPWWSPSEQPPIFGDNALLNHKKFASRLSFPGGNRPLMLTIETVNTCNFDCIFCPYSSATRPKTAMPLDLFELALDQYVAMGGGCLSLTPMVGDVFLDRFLPQRVRLIRKRPSITNVSITTNGSLFQTVNDEDFNYIVNQLYRIQVSLYGIDPAEHSLITRRALFDRVIENVRRLLDVADKPGKVHFGFRLLQQRSEGALAHWIQQTFGRQVPFGSTVEYMNWISAIDTTKPLPLDGRWIEVTPGRNQCFLPMLACHVFANGDVTFCPCDDHNGLQELHLGNILERPLAEIYNSERVRDLWKQLPAVCSGCTAYRPLSNIETYAASFDDPIAFAGG
jgi:MoaA/NifB/PqqE/SkfB family radical SAM enzyme